LYDAIKCTVPGLLGAVRVNPLNDPPSVVMVTPLLGDDTVNEEPSFRVTFTE